MKELDEAMRRRLRELARVEESPLGPEERRRILAQVRERSAPPRVSWLGAAAFAAAAALAVAWWSRPDSLEAPADQGPPAVHATLGEARETAPARQEPPGAEAPVEAPVEAPSCATDPVPPVRQARWHGGRRTLDLEGRARFVLSPRARAQIAHQACTTTLTLTSGRVLVHAEELGGGELVVRTEVGDVVVRGTVFDVGLDRQRRLTVSVAEGEVEVRADDAERRLAAGMVLEREDGGEGTVRALGEGAARAMLATLRRPATARVTRAADEELRVPRGEVVGGVPMVHQPGWSRTSTDDEGDP